MSENEPSPSRFAELFAAKFGEQAVDRVIQNGKLVDEDASLFIRAYLYDSITDAERRLRKQEVIDALGLSSQQVAAVYAWIKYRNRSCKDTVSDTEAEEIREYMKDVRDGFERALLIFELRSLYSITIDAIEDVFGDAPAPAPVAETPVHEQQLEPVPNPESEQADRIEVGEGSTGDLVSYDNTLKQQWRQQVLGAIVKHIGPARRAKTKVLTLPGRKCLEIPGLLSIGIQPENIVGVEGGSSEARTEFLEHAAHYGIDTRIGQLQDILPEEKTRFGAVLLDFHGPWSPSKETILRHLLLHSFAVVMINVLAKREGTDVQLSMREIDAQTRCLNAVGPQRLIGSSITIDPSQPDPDSVQQLRELFGAHQQEMIAEGKSVRDLRDAGTSDLVSRILSEERPENCFHLDLLDRIPGLDVLGADPDIGGDPGSIRRMQAKFLCSLLKAQEFLQGAFAGLGFSPPLRKRLEMVCIRNTKQLLPMFPNDVVQNTFRENPKALCESIPEILIVFMRRLAFARPRIIDMEKLRYESQSGAGTSTFLTDVFHVETPFEVAQRCERTLELMLRMTGLVAWEGFADPKFIMLLRDKHQRRPNSILQGDPNLAMPQKVSLSFETRTRKAADRFRLKMSDVLVLRDGNGRPVFRMPFVALVKDLNRFLSYVDEVGMDDDFQSNRRLDPRLEIQAD